MAGLPNAVGFSQDAAIVLALAGTAVPFAASAEDEAERWLRVMRMHGQVGRALQALGVGEAPLETAAQPEWVRLLHGRPLGEDIVEVIAEKGIEYAFERSAPSVGTIDILFALLETYGKAFDRALYVRGTSREELIERLGEAALIE